MTKFISHRKRLFLTCIILLFLIPVVVAGGLFLTLGNAPFGMFGGDCPDPSSYGGAAIQGTAREANGNPTAGVKIHIQKAKGWCPQSWPEDFQLISDTNGHFAGSAGIYLGDPKLHITVSAGGYSDYGFDVDAAIYQNSIVEIEIILSEQLQVNHFVISSDYATTEARIEALTTATAAAETEAAK